MSKGEKVLDVNSIPGTHINVEEENSSKLSFDSVHAPPKYLQTYIKVIKKNYLKFKEILWILLGVIIGN